MTHATYRTDVPDWTSAPIGGLIRHILERHHEYLRAALPRIEGLAVEAAQWDDKVLALQRTFLELKRELESHLWKEETVLFPLVLALDEARAAGRPAPSSHCGSVANPIRVMEFEHDSAKRALAEMRRITGGYSATGDASESSQALYAGLAELETDLFEHIRLENDVLFPRTAQLEGRPA